MMLEPVVFSPRQCLAETREFQAFLSGRTTLKERDEILPFFKARKQLSAFLGVYSPHTIRNDRVAHEYPLFGDFTCDLVAGDWARRAYLFVEFEDAASDSVFVQKRRRTPEWSPRFEQGFSQIVDWFYKLDTQRHSADFEERFGNRVIYISGLLVIGRKQDFGPRETDRLSWRDRCVAVNGNNIRSMTFDDLCEDMLVRLSGYSP